MRSAIRALIFCVIPLLLQAGCADRDFGDRLPTVGRPMPAFDLPMLDGARATSSSVKGTPVLVALWSSNCSASRLALQALASIEKDYAARGMRVLVLANDADPKHLRTLMEQEGVTMPVAYASGTLEDLFDGDRAFWQHSFPLPSYLILDADGQVVHRDFGVPLEEAQTGTVRLQSLRNAADAVLAGKQPG